MRKVALLTALCVGGMAFSADSFAAETHKMSTVMKKGFKADDGPYKKALAGEASAEELKTLYAYVQSMAKHKVEKGEQTDYDAKVKELVAAAKKLMDGDKSAAKHLKAAGNCKACHKAHKPNLPQRRPTGGSAG